MTTSLLNIFKIPTDLFLNNTKKKEKKSGSLVKQNIIQVVKLVPRDRSGYETITLNEVPLLLEDRRWWIFRLEITTHLSYIYLKGKVWKKGETEPGSWLLEASDHSTGRYENGQAGVWTINAGASYRGAKFDNFKMLSLEDH